MESIYAQLLTKIIFFLFSLLKVMFSTIQIIKYNRSTALAMAALTDRRGPFSFTYLSCADVCEFTAWVSTCEWCISCRHKFVL